MPNCPAGEPAEGGRDLPTCLPAPLPPTFGNATNCFEENKLWLNFLSAHTHTLGTYIYKKPPLPICFCLEAFWQTTTQLCHKWVSMLWVSIRFKALHNQIPADDTVPVPFLYFSNEFIGGELASHHQHQILDDIFRAIHIQQTPNDHRQSAWVHLGK